MRVYLCAGLVGWFSMHTYACVFVCAGGWFGCGMLCMCMDVLVIAIKKERGRDNTSHLRAQPQHLRPALRRQVEHLS